MNETDLKNLLLVAGFPAELLPKENDMGWLTLLLTWLPKLIEFIKLLLKLERDATAKGIVSPVSAAIDVLEKTGDMRPFLAAVSAAEAQEKKLSAG